MSAIRNALISCQGSSCMYPIESRPMIQWQLDQLDDVENIIIAASGSSQIMRAVLEKRPDAIFALNHGREASPLHSMEMGVRFLREPLIYLDGGMMIPRDAIDLVSQADCPSIGIRHTVSRQSIYVRMGHGHLEGKVIGFTSQPQDYEWVGIAKLHPQHVKSANGVDTIHKAIEVYAPLQAIHVDGAEIMQPPVEDEFDRAASA